jgi:DNA-directed RNA polymerase sigma subunit (sigma70/sigma32)
MEDWTLRVAPWQQVTEPDTRVRAMALGASAALASRERAFLQERFGWSGGPPRTLSEMAAMLGLTPMRAAQRERLAVRAALAAGRAGEGRVAPVTSP